MKCECCGAEISPGKGKCDYCGAGIQSSGCPSRQLLFAHIRQSPEYQRRDSPQRRAALPNYSGMAQMAPIVFLGVFIAIAVVMEFITLGMAGVLGAVGFGLHPGAGAIAVIPLMMSVVPLGFVVLGGFLIRQTLAKARAYQDAPLLAEPAVLVGKRTQISGGSNNHSASTTYYLTAESADGTRQEYTLLAPDLYGRIAEGDAGILFTRASYALDFDRVSVPMGAAEK